MSARYLLTAIAGILMIFCASGLVITGFSPYLPYLITLRDFSNTQVSVFIFIRTLTGVLCMLPLHRIIERFSLRLTVFAGMLMCTAAFVIYSASSGFVMMCAGGALAGAGYCFSSFIPVTILITRWFERHTGLLLGICMSSSGLGAFIGAPIITRIIEEYSLAFAFMSQAAVFLMCSIFVALVVRDDPAKAGLSPFGHDRMASPPSADDLTESSESRFAERNAPAIWITMILIGWFIFGAPSNSLHFNLSVLYQSVGFDSGRIAVIVSLFGISLAAGKCICGFLSDQIGIYHTVNIFFCSEIIGNALCCGARLGSFPAACAGSVLIGFGLAVATVGCAPYAMRIVTEENYPRLVSRFQFVLTAGGLIFSLLPGILADYTGDYIASYIIMLALSVISFILIQYAFRRAVSDLNRP